MYGVVEIAGHQYKVQAGDIIDVQRLKAEENADLEFDQVYFTGGDTPLLGKPVVNGAKVKAKVIRQARSRKLLVFKRKPGMYQKKKGHRQHYTGLLITEIDNGNGAVDKIDASSEKAKKYLK
ncbi:MAG: 50S ribosomal protein L21 [Bacteriovoracaceae bacterium]